MNTFHACEGCDLDEAKRLVDSGVSVLNCRDYVR